MIQECNYTVCLNCAKEIEDDSVTTCECGSRNFIYSKCKDDFKLINDSVICKCGSKDFRRTMHIDFKHKSSNTYVCVKCQKILGTECYRDESDLMMGLR